MIDENRLLEELMEGLKPYDQQNNGMDPDMFFIRVGEVRRLILAQPQAERPAQRIKARTISKVETTWENIAAAAAEGTLAEVLRSGDRIPLTLTNGDEVGLDVGRDESGRFFFIFHNTMTDRHHMNPEWTNKGGWRDSDMRRYANEEVYNLLPEEVKAIIKPTTIVQVLNGERIETSDNLFCLSATQVFGKDEYWEDREPEDTQIDIFRDTQARCKIWLGADEVCASWWWLRSAYGYGSFRCVYTDGSNGYHCAHTSGAMALGFCIENQ